MDWLNRMWHTATTAQPVPEATLVWGSGLLVLVVLSVPVVWHVLRHLVTIVHEAGHAGVAVLAGRRLTGIRVHTDTSGLTTSSGRRGGPGLVLTLSAGYPAPAVVGLGVAWLLSRGYAVGALWALLLLLVAVLLRVRNLYGLWVVLVSAGVLVAVTGWAPVNLQVGVAYLVAWLLLLGAPRAVLEMAVSRRRGTDSSDAGQLARLTGVWASVWVGLFFVVTVWVMALGVWLLAPTDSPDPGSGSPVDVERRLVEPFAQG
ncbi:MAG: M50 family metallopeptidase [Cellulomonas sp.]|nr:M50 family metallopeptidase [Cellulomonas sp.]